jgi:hypothetical protein
LPKLSDEFQTRVSMTINEKIRVEDAVILFDRNARKSEAIFHNADNKITRLIYYFDKDEVFTIESNKKKFQPFICPSLFPKITVQPFT